MKVDTPDALVVTEPLAIVPDPAVVEQSAVVYGLRTTDVPLIGFPYASKRLKTGWVENAVPAETGPAGGVVNAKVEAEAAATAMACEEQAVMPPVVAFR